MSGSSLDELIGLESAKRVLKGLGTSGGAHAVLLYGGEGAGKSTLARLLAAHMLCSAPTADGPCGACAQCNAFARGNCADYLVVEPQPPSNIIRLNQIHPTKEPKEPPHIPIQVFLRTAPLSAAVKVVLIEDADRMNADASNAMLKTLEEPNPFARLILTTRSVSRLPATVLSRCLAIACEYPRENDLRARVPELTDEQALASGGSVGEALRIQTGAEIFGPILALVSDLESLPAGAALVAADRFRSACERIAESEGCAPRHAQAEALKLLARCIMKKNPERRLWALAAIETHRRIAGNASAGPALDALFARVLTSR